LILRIWFVPLASGRLSDRRPIVHIHSKCRGHICTDIGDGVVYSARVVVRALFIIVAQFVALLAIYLLIEARNPVLPSDGSQRNELALVPNFSCLKGSHRAQRQRQVPESPGGEQKDRNSG
jgi:hypothetical protein